MNNRLGQYLRAPADYASDWLSRFSGASNNEFTRLTSFAGQATWNPASVADKSSTSTTVTCPGVKANAPASVRVFPPYTLSGMSATGYVSADNTVTIVLMNNTGGAVDLGSGLWSVIVENFVLT